MGRRRTLAVLGVAGLAPAALIAAGLGSPTARTYRIVPGRGKITVNVQTDGLITENQGPIGPGRAIPSDQPKVLIDGKLPQPHDLQRLPSRMPYDSSPRSPVKGLTLEARDYRGSIVFDPVHPKAIQVELHVSVRSLEPIAPSLQGEERNEVIDWLRSTWILDMNRAREISFVGSGAKFHGPAGGGFVSVAVPGRLEIHHRMSPVTLNVLAKVTPDGVEVSGRSFVNLRSFDIIPLRDRTGVYRIRREVEVDFHVMAVPETEVPLRDDEVKPPVLGGRAEHSGELTGKVPEQAELKVPEEAPLKVPEEAELKNPHSGDFTGKLWVPEDDGKNLLPTGKGD